MAPWGLPDGTYIGNSVAKLSIGMLRTSIDMTETGAVRTFDPSSTSANTVWGNGFRIGRDCNGWSSTTAVDGGALRGECGRYRMVGDQWFFNIGCDCATPQPLYCAQVGAGGGIYPPVVVNDKRVFVLPFAMFGDFAGPFSSGDGGVDSVHAKADQFCNAGQVPTFHAWISSTATSADAYFASLGMDGPWYTTFGHLAAVHRSDLTTSPGVFAAIDAEATGPYVLDENVWTGTNADGTTATDNCANFSSRGGNGMRGITDAKDLLWASYSPIGCGSSARLYCFQE